MKGSRHSYKHGDKICSAKHRGELVVAVAGRRVLICCKRKKDGVAGKQEVVVSVDDVQSLRLTLPT